MDLLENNFYESLISKHYKHVTQDQKLTQNEKDLFGIKS